MGTSKVDDDLTVALGKRQLSERRRCRLTNNVRVRIPYQLLLFYINDCGFVLAWPQLGARRELYAWHSINSQRWGNTP